MDHGPIASTARRMSVREARIPPQWPERLLGVADAAGNELFRRSMRSWRVSLSGSAILSAALASVFGALVPQGSLWTWAMLGWFAYAGQALLCAHLERQPQDSSPPPAWCATTLLLTLWVGALWGSLVWWLPVEPRPVELLGAFGTAMILLGSASASTSMGMLMAVLAPAAVLLPAGLLWHAGLPVAAVLSCVVLALIVQHGRSLQKNMLEVVRQRHQVQALSKELREQQSQLEQARLERAVLEERQRLLRDMHDGIGASLVFALKAFEQKRHDLDDVSTVLRGCLDDLRLVIDSLEPIDHDLVTLLATFRYRLGDRLDRAGIRLEWVAAEVPSLPWLNAPQALDVLRIVQEAVANVLKHAAASHLRIVIAGDGAEGELPSSVVIRVEDDGRGLEPRGPLDGRGMKHMRQRAARLGSAVEFDRSELGGLRVRLRLPIRSADGSPERREAS